MESKYFWKCPLLFRIRLRYVLTNGASAEIAENVTMTSPPCGYGRTIGDVFVRTPNSAASDPEVNVNFEMVTNGYAWHYVRYAPDNKQLADAEKQARELKLGLWFDQSPIAPWDWRKKEADKKKAGK